MILHSPIYRELTLFSVFFDLLHSVLFLHLKQMSPSSLFSSRFVLKIIPHFLHWTFLRTEEERGTAGFLHWQVTPNFILLFLFAILTISGNFHFYSGWNFYS